MHARGTEGLLGVRAGDPVPVATVFCRRWMSRWRSSRTTRSWHAGGKCSGPRARHATATTGLGDGPAGLVLNPRPRNFHVATGWTNGARISDIYRTLQEGIVKNGMASYAYLPPADRFALIHLIRSFHPAPPVDADADIASLETLYQLSKGTTIAAQVPIVKATKTDGCRAQGRTGCRASQTCGRLAGRRSDARSRPLHA